MNDKIKQQLNDLLTEFDEMGYSPTTLCKNPEETVKEWKACLIWVISKIEPQARKETAKEILQTLYNKCYEYNPRMPEKYREHIIPVEILEIARDYGVKIEERNNFASAAITAEKECIMNKLQIWGNLVKDCEQTSNGGVKFRMAVGKGENVIFVQVYAPEKVATKNVVKGLEKGKLVEVFGFLCQYTYDEDGRKRTTTYITANEINLSPLDKQDVAKTTESKAKITEYQYELPF